MLLARIRHGIWSAVVGVATLVFVIEEWLWDALVQGMQRLGRLPGIRQLESWIAGLPPAGAAFFFVLPTTLALPVKLVALHAIANGHFLRGTLVIIGAKVLATALFARIYVLTQPALLRVRWFVAVRAAILRWRAWAYAQIEAHPAWRAMRAAVARLRARLARWRQSIGPRGRFWKALRRLRRMRRQAAANPGGPPGR